MPSGTQFHAFRVANGHGRRAPTIRRPSVGWRPERSSPSSAIAPGSQRGGTHGSPANPSFMKVLSVVGNRPQFVKSAPLSLALREAGIDEVVLHTGQHWDPELSQVFFDELGLDEPAYRLELHTA